MDTIKLSRSEIRGYSRRFVVEFSSLTIELLGGVNVAAGADLLQQLLAWRVIQIQNRQRGAAGLISTQRHSGDVNVVFAEQCANATDDSRTIGIFQNKNDAMGPAASTGRLLTLTIRGVAPKNAPPTETVFPSAAADNSTRSV